MLTSPLFAYRVSGVGMIVNYIKSQWTPLLLPYRRTFARLLGFLRPYRLSLVVSMILAAVSQGASIALVLLTGPDHQRRDQAARPQQARARTSSSSWPSAS